MQKETNSFLIRAGLNTTTIYRVALTDNAQFWNTIHQGHQAVMGRVVLLEVGKSDTTYIYI